MSGRGWRHPSLLMVLVFMGFPRTLREGWAFFQKNAIILQRMTSRNLVIRDFDIRRRYSVMEIK